MTTSWALQILALGGGVARGAARARWAAALAVGLLCGCEALIDSIRPRFECPASDDRSANVEGRWALEGQGQRTGCADPTQNSDDVQLSSSLLHFTQSGETLSYAGPSTSPGVQKRTVTGSVHGCVVKVTVQEQTTLGPTSMVLEGIVASKALSGTVRADGPGTCRLEGTFEASPH